MRPRSIRARLTLWYTSLLTITILLLGASAYGLLGYSLARDIDRALQGVAVALSEQSSRSRLSAVAPDIDAIFRRFLGCRRGIAMSSGVILGVTALPELPSGTGTCP